MDIELKVGTYESQRIIDEAIKQAISEHVEPMILDYLKKAVSTEEVGEIILKRIRDCLSYSSQDDSREPNSMAGILKNRIEEISGRITDEDLKNALLKKFLSRV